VQSSLTDSPHKQALLGIIRAGIDAVSAARVVERAIADVELASVLTSRPNHVIAVGKAAAAMAGAFLKVPGLNVASTLAIGTHGHELLPAGVDWIESSHPFPDARSQAAGERAVRVAEQAHSGDALVLLISGGASALMAAPIDGISLADKIATTKVMMNAGADIHALNTVRRHLSKVKGGRLAAACVGTTVTLALSDVVGDDINAIGSGPGVPDASTWRDAAAALEQFGGAAHAPSVRDAVTRGLGGQLADTPKRTDRAMARATARVIGSRVNAMQGAAAAAEALGYQVVVIDEPVIGEARDAAPRWLDAVRARVGTARRTCVISSGETTVRVTGAGKGGRNLEFALALVEPLAAWGAASLASVGTDGIDGSSVVAGAIASGATLQRSLARGLEAPDRYLTANDSFAFFAPLDDTVRIGRTDTNVGDLQVLLID
jgi:hydroxypyruvate reductase